MAKNCCLVTVSQRIADVAIQQGWHNVVVSAGADNQSLLNTLLNEVTPPFSLRERYGEREINPETTDEIQATDAVEIQTEDREPVAPRT